MVFKKMPNVVVATMLCFSFGAIAKASAATVWVPNIQLEQFWSGGQWNDTIVDTNSYLDANSLSSVIHAENSNPNGLIDNYVTLNEYDDDKSLVQQVLRSFDKAQGEWADTISGNKWTRMKDNNKRDTAVEKQIYNPADKKWYKSTRSKYHFHANGLIDTIIEAVWDTSGGVGKWMNTQRIVESYNTGRKSVLTLTDVWLKGDARWLKMNRESRVYNTKGLQTFDTLATWDTTTPSKYVYTTLRTYDYDGADKDTCNITLSYSKSLDDFLNIRRETFAYDNNGNQTAYVQYHWTKNASGTGMWLQMSREIQTFNAKSQISTRSFESYDSAGSKWIKDLYDELAYDGNDNTQSLTSSMWDTSLTPDAYVPVKRIIWSYITITVGVLPPVASFGIVVPRASLTVNSRNAVVSGREGMIVSVFGMNGRKVARLSAAKGSSMIVWNYSDAQGNRVAKGNYILKVCAPGLNKAFPLSIYR
jgi:hypothetical protein